MRSAIARNFASRSPTTSVTGIASSPSRSHSGGITPVPSPRSWAACSAALRRIRSACAAAATSAGWPANSGCAAHSRANASTPIASIRVASASSACRRAARSPASARPGLADTSTRRSHPLRDPQRERQREPPAHRVAGERERRRGERLEAVELGLPRPGAQVGGERAVASRELAHHPIPARAGLREAVEEDEVGGHETADDASHRHVSRPACLRRRAGALRPARGVHLPRLALDAARAVARTRAAHPRDLAHRRALRRLLRARPREGDGPAGRAGLHARHRRGQLRPRGDRGARGARAAARPHRGPPAGAARARRRADDRPGQALRQRGQVVPRGRRPPGDARAHALAAPARLPRVLDRDRRPPRPGAPQLRAARAARARRAAPRRGAGRRRPRRRPPVGDAPAHPRSPPPPRCSTACAPRSTRTRAP